MRKAEVYRNGVLAGVLTEENSSNGSGYVFRYDDTYFTDKEKFAISLTMPKTKQEYKSEKIFPFFSNMIAEGANLAIQSRYLKIDERDVLGLLGATGNTDTIGAVTVKLISQK
jgi:serine/threonine-protein kinase HipA